MAPEQKARKKINHQLQQAGWIIQSKLEINDLLTATKTLIGYIGQLEAVTRADANGLDHNDDE